MKEVGNSALLALNGGLSLTNLGNGIMQINGSIVDLMNKPTITQKVLDGIDMDTGQAKYKYENTTNPQYRGDLVPTTSEIFTCSLVFGAALVVGIVSIVNKRGL